VRTRESLRILFCDIQAWKTVMTVNSTRVAVSVSDGTQMQAYVSRPDSPGSHPGIIVLQEAMGVNAQLRGVADRYAELGFVAIAPDLFHRVKPGYETSELNMEVLMPLIRAMTPDAFALDTTAAYNWLTTEGGVARDKVAAMGFCMGGRAAFIANTEVPLAAAISYYASAIAPALLDRVPNVHGPHLFFWGGRDKGIPPEQRRAVADTMREAGKKFIDVEFSDCEHVFFNEQVPARYNAAAAKQSWALGLTFLENALGVELRV
jgi:carboxymethylenebutenolidase